MFVCVCSFVDYACYSLFFLHPYLFRMHAKCFLFAYYIFFVMFAYDCLSCVGKRFVYAASDLVFFICTLILFFICLLLCYSFVREHSLLRMLQLCCLCILFVLFFCKRIIGFVCILLCFSYEYYIVLLSAC